VAEPKSFVVIHWDDVSRDQAAMMPLVGALAASGTVYSRAFTNVPLCGPSRAAFLTGQEAETTGLETNSDADWGTNFVPQALRQAGYRTMMIGKMPNGYTGTPAGLGFNRWAVLTGINAEDRYFDAEIDVNGTVKAVDGYTTDELYRRGRNCVTGSRPFFCWIAAIGAHAPANPAPRHVGGCNSLPFNVGPAFNEADMSDKPSWMQALPLMSGQKMAKAEANWRDHCATLLADDEGVASIINLADPDVCVILTADNGRMHGQHRVTGKSILYEESIGVPLITWNCGTAPGTDSRLVSNVDVPAHILSLAGVQSLRPLDGRPLDGAPRSRVRIVGGTDVDAAGWRRANTVEWIYGNGEFEAYDLQADQWQERSLPALPRRRRQ
jgi:N-acetylglucosamine-6-sulfatase